MSQVVSVIAAFGTFHLGDGYTEKLVLGKGRALVIDNTETPPKITVNGQATTPLSVAYHMAVTMIPNPNNPIPANTIIPFTTVTSSVGGISENAGGFQIEELGMYEVTWQVPVVGACQTELWVISGSTADGGPGRIARTTTGRSAANTQVMGRTLVQVTALNTRLGVYNGASGSITLLQNAGGSQPSAASLTVRRVY